MGLWSYGEKANGRESRVTETRVRDLEDATQFISQEFLTKKIRCFCIFLFIYDMYYENSNMENEFYIMF